jgi:XTP/dITP diphosphohydrolase
MASRGKAFVHIGVEVLKRNVRKETKRNMSEPSELLIATNNAGKVREISQLLRDAPLRLRMLNEFPEIPEAEETGTTFAENATLKALHYSALSRLYTLSDDSGLEVAALGNAPGVYSARYGGPNTSYAEKIERLLSEVAATGDTERRARFVCVVALIEPSTGELQRFEGICDGRIADAPRGTGGFGYDPVFIPEGHTQTFGELHDTVKQEISHRARALAQATHFLRERFPERGLTREQTGL